MTLMRVAQRGDMVLAYDADDVEHIEIETPNDIHEVGATENGCALRELGQAHLLLLVDFKDDKRPLWIQSAAAAALPDLDATRAILAAALDAEELHPALASRIFNRFFYGNPTGPITPTVVHELLDEQEVAECAH